MSDGPPESPFNTEEQSTSRVHRRAKRILATYWLALAVSTHWPLVELPGPELDLPVDKFLHLYFFGLLAFLMTRAGVGRWLSRWISAPTLTVILVGAGYALLDETTQGFTGRDVSVKDLIANWIGVIGGAYLGRLCDFKQHVTKLNPANQSDPAQKTFVGHAVLVSALTFVSRLLGLARDATLAACFGMTGITDAFWIAFVIPNLFRRLFGEGALTAAFIPIYTRLTRDDPTLARRLVWACVGLLAALLGTVALAAEAGLLWMLRTAATSADANLALRLTMVMLPYMPMVCVVALLGAVLQVRGRFGPPAAAPVILNLVMIGAAVGAVSSHFGEHTLADAIHIVAWAVLAAGTLQLVWMLASATRYEPITLRLAGTGTTLWSVVSAMGPTAVGLAVFQINALMDSLIAWGLSPTASGAQSFFIGEHQITYPVQNGAVTALQFAQRLYQFPLGVFGVALATAIFPALARTAPTPATPTSLTVTQTDTQDFTTILRQGLRLAVFIGLPASVGLILVRLPLARVIFERYAFTSDDAQRVALILAGYAAGVWAYTLVHVLTRTFYALHNPQTPVRIALAMVACNITLNLTLIWWLGAAALAWSTAICAAAQAAVLAIKLKRHVHKPIDASVLRSWGRSAVLTAVMAAILAGAIWSVDVSALDQTTAAALLTAMVLGGAAIFIGAAKLLAVDELAWLRRRKV